MTDGTTKRIRRQDNPRLAEIEAEIGRLTSEFIGLVAATEDEQRNSSESVWECIRDLVPWEMDKLMVAQDVLEQRDMDAEEDGQ